MTEFENVLQVLRYNARCHRASVLLGTTCHQGVFGGTYEKAVKAQTQLDEYEKAIAILENYKA